MNDLVTLCLLGIFLLVGLMLLSRLMRSAAGGGRYAGGQRPQYDDPNIESRGSFGRSGGGLFNRPRTSRQYDDPNIQSRGSFGRSGGSSPSSPPARPSSPPSAPSSPGGRVDDPNIRSRGGFGRSKK